MQVHGGTTKQDIERKVEKAFVLAKKNIERRNIYTVLFFDEANTTEAISTIKEILCDHSLNGKLLNNAYRLCVIAACNPYRK